MQKVKVFENLFSEDELKLILNNPIVNQHYEKIKYIKKGQVSFSINLPTFITNKILNILGVNLDPHKIPMRYICGDTENHFDVGKKPFSRTTVIYLSGVSNSEGKLIVNEEVHQVNENTAYVFSSGLEHKTDSMTDVPRLLIGPMSEEGFSVGSNFYINYYNNFNDAMNDVNIIDNPPGSVLTSIINANRWNVARVIDTNTSTQYSGNELTNYIYQTNDDIQNSVIDVTLTNAIFYVYPSPGIFYFNSSTDAITALNTIAVSSGTYQLGGNISSGSIGNYSSWRIANFIPANPPAIVPTNVFTNGTNLSDSFGEGTFYVYFSIPCFLRGSRILCAVGNKEEYIPVENLKPGSWVKTSRDGFQKIQLIGKSTIHNSGNNERFESRLYKLSKKLYPELCDDLYLTGCHSLLVDSLNSEQIEKTREKLGKVFITDRKYRLMACLDNRAEPWQNDGVFEIWHFALESDDEERNFGVYANGGLLVETCSIRFLKNKSNMNFVH